jgi:GxxExxY protein
MAMHEEPDAELDSLSYAVIGAAIEVHRHLGPGLDEGLYEEAMAVELNLQNIKFTRQVMIPVTCKSKQIGEKRLDFLIDGRLIVELKAIEQLTALHKAQVLTYLNVTRLKLGLLINFNSPVLKDGIKRIIRS